MRASLGEAWHALWLWCLPPFCVWTLFCLWLKLWLASGPPSLGLEIEAEELFLAGFFLLLMLAAARVLGWAFIPAAWLQRYHAHAKGLLALFLALIFFGPLRCITDFYLEEVLLRQEGMRGLLGLSAAGVLAVLLLALLWDSARHGVLPAIASVLVQKRRGAQRWNWGCLGLLLVGLGYAETAPRWVTLYGLVAGALLVVILARFLPPDSLSLPRRWRVYWGVAVGSAVLGSLWLQVLLLMAGANPEVLPLAQSLSLGCLLLPGLVLCSGPLVCRGTG